MFNLLKKFMLISLLALSSNTLLSQDITAKEVVEKAQDKVNGLSSHGIITMTIVRPDWSREVSMKTWSLGTDFYMIYITSPARDKGQVFLKRYNDMWNWMPSISRMIKIPPSMMGQSWMGSDFTNDDLVKMNSLVEDYVHSFTGEDTIEGYESYIIEFIPKPDAAVVWGKIIMWITKEDYFEMKAEYYDEDGYIVNEMIASEIKFMGDRDLPSKMVMVPKDEEGHETRMEFIEMEFNIDIEESFFSQQNMKKVR
jgi:outer membrane lipoprotein-sorting protein